MTWQFSQVQDKGAQSYLANWCPSEKDIAHSEGGRVAWCYGDLGASMAILTAARLAKRDDWEIKALDMARQAAARPLNTSGVRDTSLCHGSAGNTLIFQRLFLLTGEECFWQAAQMYLEHLINSRNPGGPFGGYTTYKPETDADSKVKENVNPYKSDPGLLEGAAGAGLVLLAALGVEPKWDRFLLHSLSDGF
jgi:lantibiotic modifying enzyme